MSGAGDKGEKNILVWIVDDEPDMRNLASMILIGFGWKVETFESGAACLERAERLPVPNALILDVMMPRMSGFEVSRALRSKAEFRNTFIAFLSVLSAEKNEEKALQSGGDQFLEKCFEIEKTLRELRNTVEMRS